MLLCSPLLQSRLLLQTSVHSEVKNPTHSTLKRFQTHQLLVVIKIIQLFSLKKVHSKCLLWGSHCEGCCLFYYFYHSLYLPSSYHSYIPSFAPSFCFPHNSLILPLSCLYFLASLFLPLFSLFASSCSFSFFHFFGLIFSVFSHLFSFALHVFFPCIHPSIFFLLHFCLATN